MSELKDLLDRRARNLRPAPNALERVHRRARQRHRNRRITAGVVAAVVFAGAGAGLWAAFGSGKNPAPHPTVRPATTVTVHEGSEIPGSPFVAGTYLFGLPGGPVELAEQPIQPLAGWIAPVAILTPDRSALLYNTSTELTRFDIRVHDLQAGRDRILAPDAYSMALRSDGAFAFFQKTQLADPPGSVPLGQVVVRPSLDGPPALWTRREARYIVAAWAGKSLLVYRQLEGERLDLYAVDAPGGERLLAAGSSLVAVSPDGTRALVSAGADSSDPPVSIVDVRTGERLAALREAVDPVTNSPIGPLSYAGSWVGDRAVAQAGDNELVVLRTGDSEIEVERVLRLDGVRFGPYEPQLNPSDPARMTADGTRPDGKVQIYLECDLVALRCTAGEPGQRLGSNMYRVYNVYNPSRPAP